MLGFFIYLRLWYKVVYLFMTKADKKIIQKMIKSLPPMQSKEERTKQTVYGSTLIEKGSKQKGINPNGRYLVSVPVQINHKTQAEKMFKKHGINGVKTYCLQIMEIIDKEINEKEETKSA